MVVVAVAGGTGKLGRAIVDVLVSENKHQVVVFGRKVSTLLYLIVNRKVEVKLI